MAVLSFCQFLNSPPPSFSFASLPKRPYVSSSSKSLTPPKFSASLQSSSIDLHTHARTQFLDFPFASAACKNLMVELVSTLETRLAQQLLPCDLPLDRQHFQNESGTNQLSLYSRSGHQSSPVDFILGNWLCSRQPTGAMMNVTSVAAYLNISTDAPNFIVEFIQTSPTSLLLILDLPPRKDLVHYPDYLETFYENTKLDTQRLMLQKLPEVQPCVSPSLYLRSVLSPTTIMARIDTEAAGSGRLEEIINDHIDPVAKEVLGIWLDHCACGERGVNDEEKVYLKKRDVLVRKKFREIDMGSNLATLFGKEMTERCWGVISDIYGI